MWDHHGVVPKAVELGSGYTARRATSSDVGLLTEMLYLSLFVPPGGEPFERSILEEPAIRHYVEDFGAWPHDVGFVALDTNGEPVGAAWARCFPEDEPGYGWAGTEVPELSIAVAPAHRDQGIGAALIDLVAEAVTDTGHVRLTLSVDERSPARALYERCGFAAIGAAGGSLTMVRPPIGT